MDSSAQTINVGDEPIVAAIDLDGGDWFVAISDSVGIRSQTLGDSAELTQFISRASCVIASEECRDELRRVMPELKAGFIPRLEAIGRTLPAQIGRQPCVVLWMGRKGTTFGLWANGKLLMETSIEAPLTLRGIFNYFVDTVPSLNAWMTSREEKEREQAFEDFLANLKCGTTAKVGPARWMRSETKVPASLLHESLSRLRKVVDGEQPASSVALSGWAAAAHWDLPQTLASSLNVLPVPLPQGDRFHQSLAGLISYGRENLGFLPNAFAIAGVASLGTTSSNEARVKTVSAVEAFTPLLPIVPPFVAQDPPDSAKEFPALNPVAGPRVVQEGIQGAGAREAESPFTALESASRQQRLAEIEGAQSEEIVRIARAVSDLTDRLGPSAGKVLRELDAYLTVARQSRYLEAELNAEQAQVRSFRTALEDLERAYKPEHLLDLLDYDIGEEVPERATLLAATGIQQVDSPLRTPRLSTSDLEVTNTVGDGKFAEVVNIHKCGYKVREQQGYLRRPSVDIIRYDSMPSFVPPRTSRRRFSRRLVGIAAAVPVVALLSAVIIRFRSTVDTHTYQQAHEPINVSEPVRDIWTTAGGRFLVARTESGRDQSCNLHIWQIQDWDASIVLPAPCGPSAISPDGSLAAWSSDDFLPTITKTSNLPVRTMGPQGYRHKDKIAAIEFAPSGRQLYSTSSDGTVREWNVDTGAYIAELMDSRTESYRCLLLADQLVAAGEGRANAKVKVWLSPAQYPLVLDGASDAVTALAYDTRTKTIMAGTATGQILLWRLNGVSGSTPLKPSWQETASRQEVSRLVVSNDGRLFASYANSVYSWRYDNRNVKREEPFVPSASISGVALVEDGQTQLLVTGGGGDQTIRIWKMPR